MSAIVLAGGKNYKFQSPVEPQFFTPSKLLKPLVKFGQKCLLDIQLDWLYKNNMEEITVVAPKEVFESYIPNTIFTGRGSQLTIHYKSDEGLGTAGCIRAFANPEKDYTFVINVDVLAFYNIKPLMALASPCSILLGKPRSPWGEVETDGERVSFFDEKPTLNRYVNMGHYVFHNPIIKTFPSIGSLERDVFPMLSRVGLIKGYKFNGDWYTFNSFEEYLVEKQRLERNKRR